jgi:2-polyprenyl-3-methyl-5-hydroxy-6-metoxy-1,4-benzoquinol methylase
MARTAFRSVIACALLSDKMTIQHSHMQHENAKSEFPELADENLEIWNANAAWWDDCIGDGNVFQTDLIEPASERLLAISPGDQILDVACGAGRFARRMADLGGRVIAIDNSTEFIERARTRTPNQSGIEYHVADAANTAAMLTFGIRRFEKAVCTMALMDMPQIQPLLQALKQMLKPAGAFVFSVTHPCFHTPAIQRFTEVYEEESGRHTVRSGIKVCSYLTPFAKKTEGIVGQPKPQLYFHRPLHVLFQSCFDAGFVVDRLEEPALPRPEKQKPGVRWSDMTEIPPILVVRARA